MAEVTTLSPTGDKESWIGRLRFCMMFEGHHLPSLGKSLPPHALSGVSVVSKGSYITHSPKKGCATLLIEVASAESSVAHLGSFSSFFSQAGFWDALQLLVIVLPPPYDNFWLSWNCLILGSLGSSLFSSSLCICQREMKCCWMWRTQIS